MTLIRTVREQYEELPYPPRDPAQELQKLHSPATSELALANHVLWGGRRRLDASFRALDAGCGTGDSAIFMAVQLQAVGGHVTAIDLSGASLAVVRARAEARGLHNITVIQGRLEDLPSLNLEPFDYAVSAGVLHHLPCPTDGLAAIRDVLKPDGGTSLMLYGTHGRAAIYQLQALFKLIAPPSLPANDRLRIVRETLTALPADHWAQLGRNSWTGDEALSGGAGLFDLFLHPIDRAYNVRETFTFLEENRMKLVRWLLPHQYNPTAYAPKLDVQDLSEVDRAAAAELFNSRMQKHTFFACRADARPPCPPAIDDDSAIPTWLHRSAAALVSSQLELRRELALSLEGIEYRILLDPFRRAFLRLVDGERSLGEILADVEPKSPHAQRQEKWRNLYEGLQIFNVLGLVPA